MKRIISIIITVTLLSTFPVGIVDAEESTDELYISQLSTVIQKYDSEEYFSKMTVTIGDTNIVIDGESIPIDEQGTAAYVEDGRTMMPVRKLAEAVGADVDFDEKNNTVTVQNEEKEVKLTIGENEMTVNEATVSLLKAPEIKNDRTMLPARDVAEALDCNVEWDEESETAIFTRPLQTKRLIVFDDAFDTGCASEVIKGDGFTVLQFDTISDTSEFMEANPNLHIEPDYIQSMDSLSWGTSDIAPEEYYNQINGYCGKAVIAVVDTGIDYSHDFFKNRITPGYDVHDNDDYCEDNDGHGSHVASTILDVAGVNPNIKIMPIKVFGQSGSTPSTVVAAGIDYAVEHGANVINLSLGGQHRCDIEQAAINRAVRKNVAVVAAAGNEKLDLTKNDYSPGGLDGVITVSAVDSSGNLATFSNYGQGVIDFSAAGVSVNGVKNGGGYIKYSGTSMASPHVAGAYALVMSAHMNTPVNEITEALKKNAIQKGNESYYGAGIIRAKNIESKLSVVYDDRLQIENVTDSTAEISCLIRYTGIRAKESYIKLGTSKDNMKNVYSIGQVDSMTNVDYTIKNLTSGTKYFCSVVTELGGVSYEGSIVEFTTKSKENTPSPAPEKPTPTPDNPPTENSETGIVLIPESFENLYIRTGPSTDYQILGHMDHTNKCTVFPDKTKNGWYYVKFGNIEGYAAGNYIYLKSETKTGTVNIPKSFENLYIRTGPSTNYDILGFMLNGENCTVYSDKTKNGWYYIEYNGIFGYSAGNYIQLE